MPFSASGADVFSQILDALHVAVFILDGEGHPFYANAAAIALLGRGIDPSSRPDELAETYAAYVGDTDEPYPIAQMPVVRGLGGESSFVDDMTLDRPEGRRAIQVWGAPIRDADGAVRFSVAVFTDISAQRKAEDELRMTERLASVGTLVRGLAHELNNPLEAVLGNLEIVSDALTKRDLGENGPELLSAVADARAGGLRLATIVHGLKAILRPDDDLRAMDVLEALDVALATTQNELRHRVRLTKGLEPVPLVRASGADLTRVFINLLLNAARSLERRSGQVVVNTHTDERGDAVIRIEDTGCGMSKDVLSRAFDPFFSAWPDHPQTGLGLWTCHRVVTRIGGRISLDSTPDEGTRVTITLPTAEHATTGQWRKPRAPGTRRGRVLVVDDDATVQRTMARILAKHHDVVTATTGEEALALLEQQPVDVILCDVMMPGMSGDALYGRIRDRWPLLAKRVIFVTGGAFTPAAEQFLRETEARCLEKPFDRAALLEAIQAELAKDP